MTAPDRPRVVLVPVDGTEISLEALRRAARLCRVRQSTLEVIHVMKPLDLSRSPGLGEVYRFDRRIADAEKRLSEWVRPHREGGITVLLKVLLDEDPARAIVKEARLTGAELVVLGTRGRPWWSRLLLCSVAEAVVQDCPCPVLIVRAGDEETLDGTVPLQKAS